MAKKLIIVWLSITMIILSSISIYATSSDAQDETTKTHTQISNESRTATEVETDTVKLIEAKKVKIAQEKAAAEAAAKAKAEAAAAKSVTSLSATASTGENSREGFAAYIRSVNGSISSSKALSMAGYFISAGSKYGVDPKVLMAIAQNESTFYTNASNSGYKGLMQTSDALIKSYGYSPSEAFNADVSIDVGARYLKTALNRFGSYEKAISAYTYGSGNVSSGNFSYSHANKILAKRSGIISFLENNNYI